MRTNTLTRGGAAVATAALLLTACGNSTDKKSAGTASPTAKQLGAKRSTVNGSASSQHLAALAPRVNSPSTAPKVDGVLPSAEVQTSADAQSTFAVDVDTASYTLARAQLNQGYLPDPSIVRTEEFVNAFDMKYAEPPDVFGITADGAPSLLAPDRTVLRVGLQSTRPQRDARKPAVLTFVIDISGSMADPNKLDLVKDSLDRLVDALRPDDEVQIVVYSENSRVELEATPVARKNVLHRAIDGLQTESSTNAEKGLTLGYQAARKSFRADAINRVILATDGLANQGDTSPEGILENIKEDAGKGIQLVVLGFGAEANNDPLMEKVADKGDGFYAFVDGPGEAHRLFVENLASTLETIALDAKVQVRFDPTTVTSYRLLGYDDRALADNQFSDDKVDGGEVGSGHSVTALYDLKLRSGLDASAALGTVHVRWKEPGTLKIHEVEAPISAASILARDDVSARLRLASVAAAFAEALRARDDARLDTVAREADVVSTLLPGDPDAHELASLVHAAARLVN